MRTVSSRPAWESPAKARSEVLVYATARFTKTFGAAPPEGWAAAWRAEYARLAKQEQEARAVARDFERYALASARERARYFLEACGVTPSKYKLGAVLQLSPTARELYFALRDAPDGRFSLTTAKRDRSSDCGPLADVSTLNGFVIWVFETVPCDFGPRQPLSLVATAPGEERRWVPVPLTTGELTAIAVIIDPRAVQVSEDDLPRGTSPGKLFDRAAQAMGKAWRTHSHIWNSGSCDEDAATREARLAEAMNLRKHGGQLDLPWPSGTARQGAGVR